MASTLKLGDLVVAKEQADSVERAIVNKYTLVPVGAVIAAVVITASTTRSLMSERERILVLETKVELLESDSVGYGATLQEIHDDLIKIKIKLGIADGAASRSNDEHESGVAVEDDVGRRSTARGSDFGPVRN